MNSPLSTACLDWLPEFENAHDTYRIGFNDDHAKTLADRSGLTGSTLTLITNGSPEHVQIAEMLQNMIGQIGVTIVIHNYDAAGFTAASREIEGWDLLLNEGFVPTLDMGRSMTNFMRYNNVFNQNNADSWESAMWFVEEAPRVMIDGDLNVRKTLTQEIFERYTRGCLYYSIAEFMALEAFADFVDTSSYQLNLDGTPMWWTLKFN